ncbi:hypothetical protein [Dolichospermum compactum]|uniref:Uncharacterized protein n=1 Tax=Dolichospermum compactum NIES-806 TaxID=1973481 RepID=A0A1Z4V8H4_9CYAN|nr:hypothetical protein [Dolichospermum compactum]BAZ87744.1 hypothetical protein NIES806_39750 [Dolichospermum compactum NIES-806]
MLFSKEEVETETAPLLIRCSFTNLKTFIMLYNHALETLKSLLETKPCDDIIIIKNKYKVRRNQPFSYDLFKFAYPEDENNQEIKKMECSYFVEQLLEYFGHSYPTQIKKSKIELLDKKFGVTLYTEQRGHELKGSVDKDRFFSLVGLCVHQKFSKTEVNLEGLNALGKGSFYVIANYLKKKYGDKYDKGEALPQPTKKPQPAKSKNSKSVPKAKVTVVETEPKEDIPIKFTKFLETNPGFTTKATLIDSAYKQRSYSIFGFTEDFNSHHKATYQWAADVLVLEFLDILRCSDPKHKLTTIKKKVGIKSRLGSNDIIAEQLFYKMFGLCVVMATNEDQGSFNSDELRDFGKSCFLQLIDHLRGKE